MSQKTRSSEIRTMLVNPRRPTWNSSCYDPQRKTWGMFMCVRITFKPLRPDPVSPARSRIYLARARSSDFRGNPERITAAPCWSKPEAFADNGGPMLTLTMSPKEILCPRSHHGNYQPIIPTPPGNPQNYHDEWQVLRNFIMIRISKPMLA